jgi:hypothetical protein
MAGLNKYDPKLRREQRRRNHVARDLFSPKYRQRVIPNRFAEDNEDMYDDDDEEEY